MKKQLFIQSLGCPKNLVDSEVMLGCLQRDGYEVCQDPESADLLLVNTCGFIGSAVEEAVDTILDLAAVKNDRPRTMLVVAGCMVQRYGEELRLELPEVDLFIGTDGFQNIAALVRQVQEGGEQMLELCEPQFLMDSSQPRTISTPGHRAYLKVTEGCSNRCTYCLIPSLRGPLRSRSLADLLAEARHLAESGVRELTLIAQDLTAYGLDLGPDGPRLLDLLAALLAETDLPWIRLLYLHPGRVKEELLRFIAAHPRILPYLDIPLQHVHDDVLRAMNRPYDRAAIEDLFAMAQNILPEAALRTTFMVGFPGETEAQVDEIETFLRDHRFQHVGIFTYSNEEGCAAAELEPQLAEEEKISRRERLMAVQAEISLAHNRSLVGKVQEVLVEGASRETDLLLEGRNRFQAPDVDGCILIADGVANPGDMVRVRITEAHHYDLVGEIVAAG